LDIEYVGEPNKPDGALLCVGWDGVAWEPDAISDRVLFELADPSIAKVTFTLADHRWLRLAGWKVAGEVHDVQTMCWAVDETTDLSLEACVEIYLGEKMDKRIRSVAGKPVFRCDDGTDVPLRDAPRDQLLAYNERDLDTTWRLYERMLKMLEAEGTLEYWRERCVPLAPVLVDMMVRGLPVDVAAAAKLQAQLEGEMAQSEEYLRGSVGLPEAFNLSSDKQMREYLFKSLVRVPDRYAITKESKAEYEQFGDVAWLGAPPTFKVEKLGRTWAHGYHEITGKRFRVHKYTDGCEKRRGRHEHSVEQGCNPATDSKTLKIHYGDDPWVAELLELRRRETIVQTFLSTIPERAVNGRLYGEFVQTGTKTGRLSSRRPNLQNQPSRGDLGKAMRELFVAPEGYVFVHGDYSMLEPRIMAHLSQDPEMLRIFRNDLDIYMETAKLVYGREIDHDSPERSQMKTYVLALGYGAKELKLRETLAAAGFFVPLSEVIETYAELTKVYARFFEWKEEVIARAGREHYVYTIGGHKRHLGRDTNAKGWRDIGTGARQAVNSEVQGSAADIMNDTMIESQRLPIALLVQVHDECLWLARPELATSRVLKQLQQMAEHGRYRLSVPLKFEPKIVRTWAEAK
jgi:DNA polymerase I-like protein with 3'-5' exonuclease and polymerase domains